MRSLVLVLGSATVAIWGIAQTAVGQRLGPPGSTNSASKGMSLLDSVGSLGAARQSQVNPAMAGTLQGTERFLRANRPGGGFIGIDSRERRRFIGARTETPSTLRPATPGVRIERAVAQPPAAAVARRRAGMYEPPLEIGFEYGGPMRQAVSVALARHLRSSPALDPANRIEVSVEGTTATLRGEVASERDRALAEQLVLFEPGVYAVRNELRVRSPGEAADGWRPSPPERIPKRPPAMP